MIRKYTLFTLSNPNPRHLSAIIFTSFCLQCSHWTSSSPYKSFENHMKELLTILHLTNLQLRQHIGDSSLQSDSSSSHLSNNFYSSQSLQWNNHWTSPHESSVMPMTGLTAIDDFASRPCHLISIITLHVKCQWWNWMRYRRISKICLLSKLPI